MKKIVVRMPNWLGDLDLFGDDEQMVDDIFYISSKKPKDSTSEDDYDDFDEDSDQNQ